MADSAGKVLVHVRDRVNEEALSQVAVQIVQFPDGILFEKFTGSDGSAEFAGLSGGALTIRATCQGYEATEANIDFEKGDAAVQNVDISLAPARHEANSPPSGTTTADALKIPEKARKQLQQGIRLMNDKNTVGRSVAAFQRAIESYPAYADAYFLMGIAQLRANATSAAEASLREAITLDAHMTAPYYPLSLLLFGAKRYAEERDVLLTAQKLDAKDWRWSFELARCYAQLGQWGSALQYGVAASVSTNAPAKVHLLLADIYSNSDRPREAIAELESFANLDPQSPYMERVREVLLILNQRLAATPSPSPEPR